MFKIAAGALLPIITLVGCGGETEVQNPPLESISEIHQLMIEFGNHPTKLQCTNGKQFVAYSTEEGEPYLTSIRKLNYDK